MIDAVYDPADRRPVASRNLAIVQRAAAWLIDRGASANAVSLCSIAFAGLASLCLVATAVVTDGPAIRLLFLLSALFVQARLLANLLDGMVAIGSGRRSPEGELYNEVPDRIADGLILIAAGFATGGTPSIGYVAALVAVFTAYVRTLGSSVGVQSLFMGPMAKPQRMATITAACLYCGSVPATWPGGFASGAVGALSIALALIVLGGVATAVRRLRRIQSQLRARA